MVAPACGHNHAHIRSFELSASTASGEAQLATSTSLPAWMHQHLGGLWGEGCGALAPPSARQCCAVNFSALPRLRRSSCNNCTTISLDPKHRPRDRHRCGTNASSNAETPSRPEFVPPPERVTTRATTPKSLRCGTCQGRHFFFLRGVTAKGRDRDVECPKR